MRSRALECSVQQSSVVPESWKISAARKITENLPHSVADFRKTVDDNLVRKTEIIKWLDRLLALFVCF